MQPSMFNVRVPLPDRDEVFLMNTFTDAQLIVSRDVVNLLDSLGAREPAADRAFSAAEQEALDALSANGFIVSDRTTERVNLERFFHDIRESTDVLRVTILTTLQCNFACDYCFQGDHGDANQHAQKMSMHDAARVIAWVEERLDTLKPKRLAITFFGGEPLLNLPVLFHLAERLHDATRTRGVTQGIRIITNGLLLSREIVDRLNPFGLTGVKVTLDGDRETHDRMRPLRGGQGTFDRIIRNVRDVAGVTRVAIGGNFDADSAESYPALLDFLRAQDFADQLGNVIFKPIIREPQPARPARIIPLRPVGADHRPLGGTCMTAVGSGSAPSSGASLCDSCHLADEKMAFLRDETAKRGFSTIDGVHMGPCELHSRHAYTIGPDGSLYACPGFTGHQSRSIGHIDGRADAVRQAAAEEFDTVAPWQQCGDCSFMPVCGGGCSVASYTEQGDLHAPNCHKPVFEAGLVALAQQAASA